MIERVVERAQIACLGVNSICEFGQSPPELNALRHASDNRLRKAAVECIKQAQAESDVEKSLRRKPSKETSGKGLALAKDLSRAATINAL
ncbi:hypothetical protein IB277_22310 [Ensifer sp. ENS07]|uniref:hypothetical protein n=1 Tax=Ensifer sp. ENS07 TaxID=2769274 RepID=UPI001781FF4C|nr:hypothetical protein [Ensifer sp. ENS07]MBD9639021.1 hypothetical protein [Ensifer sp. ENS07]